MRIIKHLVRSDGVTLNRGSIVLGVAFQRDRSAPSGGPAVGLWGLRAAVDRRTGTALDAAALTAVKLVRATDADDALDQFERLGFDQAEPVQAGAVAGPGGADDRRVLALWEAVPDGDRGPAVKARAVVMTTGPRVPDGDLDGLTFIGTVMAETTDGDDTRHVFVDIASAGSGLAHLPIGIEQAVRTGFAAIASHISRAIQR